MFKNLLIAVAIVVISPALVFAADDFFFAFGQGSDALIDNGASATDTSTANLADGSGSVFIFSNQPYEFDGADLEFTSDPNIIQFTGGETFNSDIMTPFGVLVKFDESDVTISNTPTVTGGRLFSVAVAEFGVRSTTTGVDDDFRDLVRVNGTDDGALLLARVDYSIVGEGTTNIEFSLGNQGVILLGSGDDPDTPLFPSFGAATLTVTSVPEPSSVALLILGSIGLVTRRKRA